MSTSTLTDRYVHEVVRRIPAGQRVDVADELRTTIADTVEARDTGDPAAAERAVLTEMGDPIRLAAGYADRPSVLIGPELYPAYLRLLKVLLVTVLPIVTIVLVVLEILDTNDVGSAIGTGIGTVLIVGGQMIAWVTVVFALVERSQHREGMIASTGTWTPDDLPEGPRPDKGGTGAVVAAVFNALMIGLIVWQHTAPPYRTGSGERLEVLDPSLWSGWIWPILVSLGGIAVLELVRVAAHGWTAQRVAWYAAAEALFALPLAWILLQHKFFNPAFLAEVNGDWTAPDAVYTVAALIVLGASVSNVVTRFREVRR